MVVWDWCCSRLGLGTSVFSFVVGGEVRRLRGLFGGFGDGLGWNLGLWWMCLLWWEVVGGCSVVFALVAGIGPLCLLGSNFSPICGCYCVPDDVVVAVW